MICCEMGKETYGLRHELFLKQEKTLMSEIDKLYEALYMIRFKIWYYETAIKNGDEEEILKMLPDKLPEEIQELYNKTHKDK